MKKIDKIYSRHERGGKYYLIARIKRDGEFVIEEIEVNEQQYRTAKERRFYMNNDLKTLTERRLK